MNKQPLVIGDADAIVALSSKGDANHEKAKRILEELDTIEADVLFPISAICEATTAIQRKLNSPEAAEYVIEQVQAEHFYVQAIEREVLFEALKLFHPHGSKKNTLFDALVAATAKRLNADAIFSFDEWYRKIGLTLAGDLVEQGATAA